MGEKYHHVRIGDVALVEELSAAGSEAVRMRDPAPLEAFHAAHGERRALLDGYRVPLEGERLAALIDQLAPLAAVPEAAPLGELKDKLASFSVAARTVRKNAQSVLLNRLDILARRAAIDLPAIVHAHDARLALAALTTLEDADPSASYDLPSDGWLAFEGLCLCAVPGFDDDFGMDDVWSETFIEGPELVIVGGIADDADPPASLFERTFERFGMYGPQEAREILLEDWLRFCEAFTYYSPPVWTMGDGLLGAAARLDDELAQVTNSEDDEEDEDEDELGRLRGVAAQTKAILLEAHRRGLAAVEWVTKS